MADESLKTQAKALIREGKYCQSLYYKPDMSMKRRIGWLKNQFHYYQKYKRYFGNKGLTD